MSEIEASLRFLMDKVFSEKVSGEKVSSDVLVEEVVSCPVGSHRQRLLSRSPAPGRIHTKGPRGAGRLCPWVAAPLYRTCC